VLVRLWLRNPLFGAIVVAALLGLSELPFAVFMADDLIQVGELEQVSPCTWLGPHQLYTISDGVPDHVQAMKETGAFPWFFGPTFKMAFFRPLSSLLLTLDHALWGLHPIGYRLQGALWFALLVVGLALALRCTLPGASGALALLVFTISGIHGSLFWTATRHIAIAGALGMLGLACHLHWRERGWRPGRWLAPLGFTLALAAGEAALATVAYLFAYELVGRRDPLQQRLRAGAPMLLLVTGYLVLFEWLGLGTSSGNGYFDPLRAPLAFVTVLPGRWLFLLGAMVAGGSADVWILRPDLRPLFGGVGAALVLLIAILLRTVWPGIASDERRSGRFWIAGAAAAAIPFAGAPIGSRCLVLPMLGGSVAIALVLRHWWLWLRRQPGPRHRLAEAGCILLAAIHLGTSPLQRLATPAAMRQLMNSHLAEAMQQADLDAAQLSSQRVVVLRAPDLVVGLHAYFYRRLYRLPMPQSWRTLSWTRAEHRFTRTSVDALELEWVDGALDAPTMTSGTVVELDGMRATVLAAGTRGPTRVEFKFDRPLDDVALQFLGWREGRLLRIALPPVGQTFSL